MEKFWIKYVNENSKVSGQHFLVYKKPGEDYHYFIADGGSHVGGGRLRKDYCHIVDGPITHIEPTWDDIFAVQARTVGGNYHLLMEWLKENYETPKLKNK